MTYSLPPLPPAQHDGSSTLGQYNQEHKIPAPPLSTPQLSVKAMVSPQVVHDTSASHPPQLSVSEAMF